MRSFSILYAVKLRALRTMETEMGRAQAGLRPFTTETASKDMKWRYRPLTLVDRIVPMVSAALFVALFLLNRQVKLEIPIE